MVASAHHQDRRNWIQRMHEGRSAICAVRLVLIVGLGVAPVGGSSPLLSSAFAGPVTPFLALAALQDRENDGIVRTKAATPLGRCLATWNNTSGMSKREWKQTCKRVVKQNPGLYSKPF